MNQAAANPLLDEIEALQDQVLADLQQLNQQVESVLKVQLAVEAGERAATDIQAGTTTGSYTRHDLPMVIRPPYLHLTTFLPSRMAG